MSSLIAYEEDEATTNRRVNTTDTERMDDGFGVSRLNQSIEHSRDFAVAANTQTKRYPAMKLDTFDVTPVAFFKNHQQESRRLASRCFALR